MNVAFPFSFDSTGRTSDAAEEQHIRQLIEQLLFTSPAERVNRPTLGSGLLRLVFAPNSPELGAATQQLVAASLQQWLGELIHVDAVEISQEDSILRLEVRYLIRRTQQRRVAAFTQEVS